MLRWNHKPIVAGMAAVRMARAQSAIAMCLPARFGPSGSRTRPARRAPGRRVKFKGEDEVKYFVL